MPDISLKDMVYNKIEHKILTCEYKPMSFLAEKDLGEEFNVSRTPIREALVRLESAGLVTVIPRRGVMVSDVTTNDVTELFQARELVEPHILLLYGPELESEHYQKIMHKLRLDTENTKTEAEQLQVDLEMHKLINGLNRNRHFAAMLKNLNTANQRIVALFGLNTNSRLESTKSEILAIINAANDGNYALAAENLRLHLRASRVAALETMMR